MLVFSVLPHLPPFLFPSLVSTLPFLSFPFLSFPFLSLPTCSLFPPLSFASLPPFPFILSSPSLVSTLPFLSLSTLSLFRLLLPCLLCLFPFLACHLFCLFSSSSSFMFSCVLSCSSDQLGDRVGSLAAASLSALILLIPWSPVQLLTLVGWFDYLRLNRSSLWCRC